MTFEQMQTTASEKTLAEIAVFEKQILAHYATAIKEIDAILAKQYASLSTVAPADYYNEVMKYKRLDTLLADVKAQYAIAAKRAAKDTRLASELAISNMYYNKVYVNSWLDEYPEIRVGALPQPLIDIAVYSNDKAWSKISSDLRKKIEKTYGSIGMYYPQSGTLVELMALNAKKDMQKIADTITTGLSRGNSYKQMTDAIRDVIGWQVRKDGKMSVTGSMYNALRIARTETTRTLNAGTHAADQQLSSIGFKGVQKQWHATLDMRTRTEHGEMDGERRALHDEFSNGVMYPSEPNCRCTTLTIIDGVSPKLRTGRDPVQPERKPGEKKQPDKKQIMDYKSFNEWAKENNLERDKSGKLYKKA